MKRVLVMRHAKSSWKDPELDDHDRPLNKRGRHDAPLMAKVLREQGLVPDWVVTSSAVRARQTLEGVLESLEWSGEVQLAPRLYLASPRDIVDVLRESPDPCRLALLVGHNPGMEEVVQGLTGEPVTMTTANVAVIDLPCDRWRLVALDGKARLVELFRPKEIDLR